MRQLVFGLYAEGPTDRRYFPTLLQRYLSEVCISKGVDMEIFDPVVIEKRSGTFVEQMQQLEREYTGLELIFVHNDADGRDANAVLTHKWQPWMERCKEPHKWLPIIPVRMLESWLLADLKALSKTFNLEVDRVGEIISSTDPESIADPKAVLADIKGNGRQRRIFGFEEVLAKRVRLSELEQLASFQKFSKDVELWVERFI